MNCSTCGSAVPADAQFCIECGSVVQPSNTVETIPLREGTVIDAGCRTCGTLNPPQALFCMRCGTPIAGATQPTVNPYLIAGAGGAALLGMLVLTRTPALARFIPMFLLGLLLVGMAFLVARWLSNGKVIPALFVMLWALGIPAMLVIPLPLRLPLLLVLLGVSVLIYVVARNRRP